MTELGIDTVPDLRSKVEDSPLDNDVIRKWKRLPSQSSGVTYNYLLILAGMPSVKPDHMILRFLAPPPWRRDPVGWPARSQADHGNGKNDERRPSGT